MEKFILQKYLIIGFIICILTACDNPDTTVYPPKKQTFSNEENFNKTYESKEKLSKENFFRKSKSSQSEKYSRRLFQNVKEKSDTPKGQKSGFSKKKEYSLEFNNKNYGENTKKSKYQKRIPEHWIDRDVRQIPSEQHQKIWKNIIAAVDRLVFARKVIYAPLGSASATLKKLCNGKYSILVRCIIISETGEHTPYLIEGVVVANSYDAIIKKIEFMEP